MNKKVIVIHVVMILIVVATIWWATLEVEKVPESVDMTLESIGADRGEGLKAQGTAMLKGAVAFIVAGLYLAFVTIKYVLPKFTGAVSDFVFSASDAPDEEEDETMRVARMFYAQGEYEASAEAYAQAALKDPESRYPVVERAKIQLENLEDPAAAAETYREALDGHDWEEGDAAFMLFRLAGLYREDLKDEDAARTVLEQVLASFPDTPHWENAMKQLREIA